MSRLLLMAALAAAITLAGCVGDEPAPPTPVSRPDDSAIGDTPSEPGAPPQPVTVPVSIDGVSPSGLWLCAAAPAIGGCQVYSPGDGNDVHEIPHEGSLEEVALTWTYTPVSPEVKGIMAWLNWVSDGERTLLATASGPSGTTLTATGINVTGEGILTLAAYTMPDADVGGAVWVELLPQEYHVSGEVLVVPETATR